MRVAVSAFGGMPGAGTEAGDADPDLGPRASRLPVIPEAPIVGRVVRAQDHEPVPGAQVMLFSEDITSLEEWGADASDSRRRARCTGRVLARLRDRDRWLQIGQ